ncbi:MAG: endonuclease/exonuclease/phosphatase family protein [Ichthyobacteriaceae bacterium]|nr:endonuclease/exonuclease/phosphatase family protein [Ichthyobacteriaceae bacterium]
MKNVLLSLFFATILLSPTNPSKNFRILFYNVENLFDTYDNPDTYDEAFTKNGERNWTNYKFWKKLKNIAKVIKVAGEWEAPDLVGLAEVENDTVLKKLIYTDVLRKWNYKIIHHQSPDFRGIDVALLYRKEKFFVLNTKFYTLFVNGKKQQSRELLYAKGIMPGGDTLHVMVAHFPSRYSGYKNSEHKRMAAANLVLSITDSLNAVFKNPNIVVMGDLNDTPNNISIKHLNNNANLRLVSAKQGTHKFHGKWARLDHFLVSDNINSKNKRINFSETANVFSEKFILQKDEKYLGFKPNRTFIGFKYNGGFSDHLPIYIDLLLL